MAVPPKKVEKMIMKTVGYKIKNDLIDMPTFPIRDFREWEANRKIKSSDIFYVKRDFISRLKRAWKVLLGKEI